MRKLIFAVLLASISTLSYASGFKLFSPDIKSHQMIAKRYVYNASVCDGENISPAINWEGAPKDAKSYALIVYDTDADWLHWAVINIPPNLRGLPRNTGVRNSKALPHDAIQMRNDFGLYAWGGPCPPKGKLHHYVFTLYAIKLSKLKLPVNASTAQILHMVNTNMISKAQLTATYIRH